MSEQFYTMLTKVGKAKIANATALGTKVNFCKFQVGDSNGAYYNPTEEQTELKHKVWEGNINNIRIDDKNPNWVIIEVILPSEIGGFTIREAAILDDEDNVIAVAKYPETYKPQTKDGSSKDILIRTILEVSNANSVTLKVDPTVILATKKDIEVLEQKIKNIKVPVTSVNTKTGDIVLKAEDINCEDDKSVESHLDDVTKNIGDISKDIGNIKDETLPIGLKGKSLVDMVKTNFTNVSDGKIKVASAVTDKGVPTLATDTYNQIATNIRNIKVGKYSIGDTIESTTLSSPIDRNGNTLKKLVLTKDYISNMTLDDNDNIYVAYEHKIVKFDSEFNKILEYDVEPRIKNVQVVYNELYIVTNDCILIYDLNNNQKNKIEFDTNVDSYSTISYNGKFAISSGGKIIYYDRKTKVLETEGNFYSGIMDSYGTLIGSYSEVVSVYSPSGKKYDYEIRYDSGGASNLAMISYNKFMLSYRQYSSYDGWHINEVYNINDGSQISKFSVDAPTKSESMTSVGICSDKSEYIYFLYYGLYKFTTSGVEKWSVLKPGNYYKTIYAPKYVAMGKDGRTIYILYVEDNSHNYEIRKLEQGIFYKIIA